LLRALPHSGRVSRSASILFAIALIALLAGCAPLLEADQARLCRMAVPAIEPPDSTIIVKLQTPFADGKGLRVDYLAGIAGETPSAHYAECRFLEPGRPRRSQDMTAIDTDRGPLNPYQVSILVRFWLSTPDARADDPEPLFGAQQAWRGPQPLIYGLQQAINGVPLAAIYALLAAAYSLVYGLVGRINLAFGELAAAGGYAASLGVLLAAAFAPWGPVALALLLAVTTAVVFGVASGRFVFAPLHRATGQQALVAAVGLSLFLQEFLRLTQGGRLRWINPILNEPFAVARAGDFVAAATPIAMIVGAFALTAAAGLLIAMKVTRFGKQWRAYADDPLAAELFGIDPKAIFAKTFALASAMAGLSGFVMTIFYGSVGYGASTALGLKALIAAILGGIGSVPGAFLGGLIIGGFEALWSAIFPIDYRDVAVYALLAVVLILRPGGIMGLAAYSSPRS
jgi:branched-chain amino acid transport system permease protein